MIYLEIPSYPDPQAPGQTFTAYGIIGSLNADFINNRGRVTIAIYRSLQAMSGQAPPVDTLIIQDGGRIIRGGPQIGSTYPKMDQIESENAEAWASLWQYFLTKAITLNGLTNATIKSS